MARLFKLIFMVWLLVGGLAVIAQDITPTTPVMPARPVPLEVLTKDGISAEFYFAELTQGRMGVVHLTGEILEARALFLNRQYSFFQVANDGWYGFVVSAIDARPRAYPLSLLVRTAAGVDTTFEKTITITAAGFINQNFNLPADRAFLSDPEVERNEFAKLDALIHPIQPERLWDSSGFQMPITGEVISAFGQYRVFNQNTQTRHTGWDQQAPSGTPVAAMSRGQVVFAGRLDIRGNYVLLDHGYGIYSGYAHFSQVNVERGQTIEKGQIIGLSGNTGRSTGPHLHWEIAVNGEWIDGMTFLGTWLPG
jgi:murein DD-endopeptidase MepM/ murein hydrolase activator NlpD